MSTLLADFFQNCWDITLELAPWLFLGAAVAGLMHVFLPQRWLRGQLKGHWGVLKSVVLGVPLPLCSCGVIPVGLSLRKNGASSGASVGFLISTPQTGVDSILVSANLLSWPFALFKVVAAAVTGVIGGCLTNSLVDSGDELPMATATTKDHELNSAHKSSRWSQALEHADQLLQSLWGWLVGGILASGLISTLIPEQSFGELSGLGNFAAMLATLLVSIPLYVCATASVPIAASLVHSGLPLGSALVFLMAGPATNLATIGAIKNVLGTKVMLVYLSTIIVGSIIAGLVFESLISVSQTTHSGHVHGSPLWMLLSQVCAVAFLALVARYSWRLLISKLRRPPQDLPQKHITVRGMTCNGCVSKLQRALEAEEGVAFARVTLSPQSAVVAGQIADDRMREIIRESGFDCESESATSVKSTNAI